MLFSSHRLPSLFRGAGSIESLGELRAQRLVSAICMLLLGARAESRARVTREAHALVPQRPP